MKKFEEELEQLKYHINTNWSGDNGEQLLKESEVIEHFKDWVSPEDHQAEIEKTELQNLKYREEIARMQKALRKKNKAIEELNGAVKKSKARLKECEDLRIEANNDAAIEYSRKCESVEELQLEIKQLKSQLAKQQPEIPEFMAEYLKRSKFRHKGVRFSLIGALKGTDFIDDKTQKWLESWYNQELFSSAWINGYTVAKEKRFYLKNKLTEFYLYKAFGGKYGEEYPTGFSEDFQFTQQEINSMETGSYEQIEVGE